jgi:hypothetical protein
MSPILLGIAPGYYMEIFPLAGLASAEVRQSLRCTCPACSKDP